MKKISFVLVLILLSVFMASLAFAAQPNINVAVNGKLVSFPDQKPYIDSANRTMVPVRFPAETLGATVDWLESSRQVHVTNKAHDTLQDADITATIGKIDVIVNGTTKNMDTVAVLNNGRTMVPVRFISEYLGAAVAWDTNSRCVHVFSLGQTEDEQKTIMQQISKELGIDTQIGQIGSKYNQLSSEKAAELRIYSYGVEPELPMGDPKVYEAPDCPDTYKGLLDKMVISFNQSFYSSKELLYRDAYGYYCLRGVLQTMNPDGSVTERNVEASSFYGGSSEQKEWGWHVIRFRDLETKELIQ